jgi:hypothetical protein
LVVGRSVVALRNATDRVIDVASSNRIDMHQSVIFGRLLQISVDCSADV